MALPSSNHSPSSPSSSPSSPFLPTHSRTLSGSSSASSLSDSILHLRHKYGYCGPIARRLFRLSTLSATAFLALLLLVIYSGTSGLARSAITALIPGDGEPQMMAWSERPRVELAQGTYVGTEVRGSFPQDVQCFLGIPYAESTGGEGRFRDPRIVRGQESSILAERASLNVDESGKSVYDAGQFGHRCPSSPIGPANGELEGEDCLNINVFRPKAAFEVDAANSTDNNTTATSQTLLPVVVYIHGGAFNFGTSSARAIRSMVAWASEPMIGVSFNYRIGAFGFLPSAVMKEAGALNLGLKDQITALQWVQENIERFGGDKTKITLMGTSAGAHSIGHLLTYKPDQPPMFRAAIIESGAAVARAVYSWDNQLHEQQYADFIEALGATAVNQSDILTHLRTLPFSTIKRASEIVFAKYNPSVCWPFQPSIDGDVIAMPPTKAWQAGRFHRVPILTGFTTNEGARFVPYGVEDGNFLGQFMKTLIPRLTPSDIEQINNLYPDPSIDPSSPYRNVPDPSLGSQFRRLEAAYSHFAYIAPVRQTAFFASIASLPPGMSQRPSVYLYHFAVNKTPLLGANHGDHSAYPTYNRGIWKVSAAQAAIASTMTAYWTSFIISGGDPNAIRVKDRAEDRPVWEPYSALDHEGKLIDPSQGKVIVFGKGNDEFVGGKSPGIVAEIAKDGWERKQCHFWWNKRDLSEG